VKTRATESTASCTAVCYPHPPRLLYIEICHGDDCCVKMDSPSSLQWKSVSNVAQVSQQC